MTSKLVEAWGRPYSGCVSRRRSFNRLPRTCALAILAGAPASALQVGEVGVPLVRCFSPEQYDGDVQIFDAAQGPDGVLYFACPEDDAVLRYDGERWRKTLLTMPVLSLDVDGDGRVWLGSSADFGYLLETAGGTEFESVAQDAVGREGSPPNFIGTRCTPRGVFFLSSEVLVLWDGARASTWRAPEDGGFMDVEPLDDDIFVLEGTHGLHVLEEGELVESDALGEERVLFDGLYSDGQRLLGVWLNADGLNWIGSLDARRSTLRVPELQRGPTYVSDVVVTHDGALVVSSANGILFVDARGEFQAWLDDDTGLPNSLAYSLLLDREGAVWASLAHGVARIDPSPSASFFGAEQGLVGTPLVLARHEGQLYCGTFEGLFRLSDFRGRARFERLTSVPAGPIYDLVSTLHGLLLGTERGLTLLDGERRSLLSEGQMLALTRSTAQEEAVVVADFDALRILRWAEGAGWSFDPPFPVSWSTKAIAADARGFWLHSLDHELFRLPYDGAFGEPVRIPGEWLGMTSVPSGLLVWNRERLELLPHAAMQPELGPTASLGWDVLHRGTRWVRPIADDGGRLWLFDRGSLRRLPGDFESGFDPEPDLSWASPFALEGVQFDELDRGVAWLDTHEGVVRLALEGLRPPFGSDPLLGSYARAGDESFGPFSPGATLPARASLSFEVAAARFDGSETSYRYRLEGLERDWSPWTPLALKEYPSLPGGAYVLHVQARKQGRILGESRSSFAVRSPWLATWPARVAGVALLAASGFGLVRWRSRRLRLENERLERIVAERTRDLEAQARAQREMHERLEVAERFESLGAVAGGIAHDFNNYLTSILGYAELALDERIDRSKRAGFLEKVTAISQQAAELCSGLLSLAGRTPLAAAPVELSQMVRGMESLLRTSVEDRGELRLELAEDLPPIACDSNHIRRALVNLAINAAEACRERRGPIVIRTGTIECSADDLVHMHGSGEREPGRYVFVEVKDQGIGMAPELLHRIFDPFFSTKFVGRGLGLSTVFRIVSSHKGAIQVRTEIGQGATVRLLFPASHAAAPPPAGALPARPQAELAGHVLVVDDDERVRGVTEAFCRRLGLDVSTAGSGQEALELLAASPDRVAAILLDLSMPGMHGLEVLPEIRRLRPDLPVLLVSGITDHVPDEVLDPATFFLAKPFSFETLAQALKDTLDRCAQRQPRDRSGARVNLG